MNREYSRTQRTRLNAFTRANRDILLYDCDDDQFLSEILDNDSNSTFEGDQNTFSNQNRIETGEILIRNEDNETESFESNSEASSDDEVLLSAENKDTDHYLLMKLIDLFLKHRISSLCLDDFLSFIKDLGIDVFPRTAKTLFKKIFKQNHRYSYSVVCYCGLKINWFKKNGSSSSIQCEICGSLDKISLLNQQPFYVNMDIIEQITTLSEKLPQVIVPI